MKTHRTFFVVVSLLFVASLLPLAAQPVSGVSSAPVFVPDYTHQNDPMPEGVLDWDDVQKSVDATNGQDFAWFSFAFTNVATGPQVTLMTNVTCQTNFTIITNHSFWARISGNKYSSIPSVGYSTNAVTVTNARVPVAVTVLSAHASCGCTQPQLPPLPWILPPGTSSVIRVSVNLAGKSGVVFKTVDVATDKGKKQLMLKINILPAPPAAPMSEEERAKGIAAAKIDRQAVFKGECATCHVKNVEGKYGQVLFAITCAICHEANPRASMVPDLHNLKDPTSEEFWRTWIISGKAGTLMPAFATSQGGPLNDMQIASLAAYLNAIIPPKPASPVSAPPPAK